jgi:hypothetical protein
MICMPEIKKIDRKQRDERKGRNTQQMEDGTNDPGSESRREPDQRMSDGHHSKGDERRSA